MTAPILIASLWLPCAAASYGLWRLTFWADRLPWTIGSRRHYLLGSALFSPVALMTAFFALAFVLLEPNDDDRPASW